ncbi:uncharacterized protein LOC117124880 [Anneissia japonica]|uniref:uncharacterized protein LOC117124880 n=1 Tax=Anneissia japonica TaxID=1529436 RepID=UPI001425AF0A|nr:uncharacterized protein LOC117124880 [Anneissia japonica]
MRRSNDGCTVVGFESSRGPIAGWNLYGNQLTDLNQGVFIGLTSLRTLNVIWLDAYTTSSDPKVIAGYYIHTVQKIMGCPVFIRTDLGTENTVVGQLQQFLSNNDRRFMQGTSQHNPRIECWWSMLRKHCSQFWMSLFQKLKHDGKFSGDHLDRSLIQFCFMKLIQDDMNTVAKEWNAHRITPSRNRHGPFGRPVMMYNVPQMFEGQDFLVPVDDDEVELCNSECTFKSQFPCDEDVFELCLIFTILTMSQGQSLKRKLHPEAVPTINHTGKRELPVGASISETPRSAYKKREIRRILQENINYGNVDHIQEPPDVQLEVEEVNLKESPQI